MIRLFTKALAAIIIVAAGWYYTPQGVKNKLLGAIGLAAGRNETVIRSLGRDVVLPADPEERRKTIAAELKKSVGEIRQRVMGVDDETTPASAAADAGVPTEQIVKETEDLIKELEAASGDKSAGAKAVERILERVLPTPQCRD